MSVLYGMILYFQVFYIFVIEYANISGRAGSFP